MGKTLARHPLINYRRVKTTEDLPPVPFLKVPDDKRPLAGIRVVELARISKFHIYENPTHTADMTTPTSVFRTSDLRTRCETLFS